MNPPIDYGKAHQTLMGSDSTDLISSLSTEQEDNNQESDDLQVDSNDAKKLETAQQTDQSLPREIPKGEFKENSKILINKAEILNESLHDPPSIKGMFFGCC